MTSGDSLEDFRRILESTRADGAVSVVALTDGLVGVDHGSDLRRCAIPHDFDADTLVAVLGVSAEVAQSRCEEFSELSIVQFVPPRFAIHERWRREIFRWWLKEENRAEFTEVNVALQSYFARIAESSSGEAAEIAARKQMYHLLGVDRPKGMAQFELLNRRARRQRRFADCAALIRLVHDYDDILTPGDQAVLAYHAGKLAADLMQWSRAVDLFQRVSRDESATTALQTNGLIRLGNALRNAGSTESAIAALEQARRQVESSPTMSRLRWRVLQELGEAYRESGQTGRAIEFLQAGLLAADDSGESADKAGLFNSLGTVYLREHDAAAAIAALNKSLESLDRAGDHLRAAQVQNNLGLAYTEIGDWQRAESAFAASLQLKIQTCDIPGQALALQNLSRAKAGRADFAGAVAAATEAARLFESVGDTRRLAIALESVANYYRRQGNIESARRNLEAARQHFQTGNETSGVARVTRALAELDARPGLPWWAWLLIALPLIAFAIVIALFVLR